MEQLKNGEIEYLKGVGPERGLALRDIGVASKWDLLNYFPFRYVDRSSYQQIKDLHLFNDQNVQLKGQIKGVRIVGTGRSKRLYARFQDDTGEIELVWFKGISWIQDKLKPNLLFRVYGKVSMYNAKWNIAHPEMVPFAQVAHERGLQPIYSSTDQLTKKGLHSNGIEKLMRQLISEVRQEIPEIIPPQYIHQYRLISRDAAYRKIHFPSDMQEVQKAQLRLKFEELLLLQLELLSRKQVTSKPLGGIQHEMTGDLFTKFYEHHLPFQLTKAQQRVVKEIWRDLKGGQQMNRLLQGDVGSGKTLVAVLSMLFSIGNGFQAALMAPTEILAQQHFQTVKELLAPLNIEVALLTGSTKTSERKILFPKLKEGEIKLLIGTHALLEPAVEFHNLALVVIDEQHRFGVAQRARLWKKNIKPPHVLVMTATPIPRTLAMTFYGDLDVSVIDELPPGRKPITTLHFFDSSRLRVFELIRKEIALGRQVYIVYPLIQESETLDYKNLEEGYEAISRAFPRPEYHISMVHGKMKPEAKAFEMEQFAKGNTHIMVATTVIEVGVNVPNASVMIIESSERFGLSQLHQLRGRVGRGAEKSYCILMTGNKLSQEGKKRINTMVSSNDGFRIAEVDLEIRGPGDIMGTQQSGLLNLSIANLATDGKIVGVARTAAKEILSADPKMENPEHQALKRELIKLLKSKPNWSRIS